MLALGVILLIMTQKAQADRDLLSMFRHGGRGSVRGRKGGSLSRSVPSQNLSMPAAMIVTTVAKRSLTKVTAEDKMKVKVTVDHCCKSDMRIRDQIVDVTQGDRVYCNSTLMDKGTNLTLQGCQGVKEVVETRVSSSWVLCSEAPCCQNCIENLTLSFQRPMEAPIQTTRTSSKAIRRRGRSMQVSEFESKSCKISQGPSKRTFIIRRLDCNVQLVITTTDVRSGASHNTEFKEGQCEVEQQVSFVNLHHDTLVYVKVASSMTGRPLCTGNMTYESDILLDQIDCLRPPCYTSVKFWRNASHKFGVPVWVLAITFSALFALFLMGIGSLAAILSLATKITKAGAKVVYLLPSTPAGQAIYCGVTKLKSWVTPTDGQENETTVEVKRDKNVHVRPPINTPPRWCATCGMFVTTLVCPTCGFINGCGNARIGIAAPVDVCPTDGTECLTNFISTINMAKGDTACIYFGQTDSKGVTFHGNKAVRVDIYQIGYEATYTELYQTYAMKCKVEGKFRCQDSGRCSSDCSPVLRDPDGSISLTAHNNVDANDYVAKLPGHASCLESTESDFFECFKSTGCQYCKAGAYPTKGPIDVVEMKSLVPFICYELGFYEADTEGDSIITNETRWSMKSSWLKCDKLEGQAVGKTLAKVGDAILTGKTNILTPQLMDKKHIAVNYDSSHSNVEIQPSWAWLVKAADVNEEAPRGAIGSVQNKIGKSWNPENTRLSHNLFERLQASHKCEYACFSSGVDELTEAHPQYLPTQYGSGKLHAGVVKIDQSHRVKSYIQVLLTADCNEECSNKGLGACVVSYAPDDDQLVLPANFPCTKDKIKWVNEWQRGEVYKDSDGYCYVGFYFACGGFFGGNNIVAPRNSQASGTVHVETKLCACGEGHYIYLDIERFNNAAKKGVSEPMQPTNWHPPALFITWIPDTTSVEAEITVSTKSKVSFFRQRTVPVVPKGQDIEIEGCYSCDFPIAITFNAGATPEATVASVSTSCNEIDLLDQSVQLSGSVRPVTIRIKAKVENVNCEVLVTAGQQSEKFKVHGKLVVRDLVNTTDNPQINGTGRGNTKGVLPDPSDLPFDAFNPSSWDGAFQKITGVVVLALISVLALGAVYCLITFCVPLAEFIRSIRSKPKKF